MSSQDTDPSTGLPVGARVDPSPAPRPQRTTRTGRHIVVAPLDAAAHAEDLYESTSGPANDRLWLYLYAGPFSDRASFDAYLAQCARSEDQLYFALLDAATGRAMGHAAYLRIEPAARSIEVGAILYNPALQR